MSVGNNLGIPKISLNQLLNLLLKISDKINEHKKQGIFIWGSPGIGKSDLVKLLADKTSRNLVDIRLSTIDPVDLRGLPTINIEEKLTKWLPPNFLPSESSEPGILFLDEINVAPPSVQTAAYQLILDRKLGDYVVPPDWIIIAAGNRLGDRAVTFRLPTALANRFTHFEIDPDIEEWTEWAWNNQIDPYIISFLRYQPHLLNQFDPENNSIAFASPRTWAFASIFSEMRLENPILYFKSIQGTIGEAIATQFMSFLKYHSEIPNPDDILSGKKFEYPTQPDRLFLLIPALIRKILTSPTTETLRYFFDYVNHYTDSPHPDYSVILVKELLTASKSKVNSHSSSLFQVISSDQNFKKWSQNNIHLLS